MEIDDDSVPVPPGETKSGLRQRPAALGIPGRNPLLADVLDDLEATGPTKRAVRIKWKTRTFDLEIDLEAPTAVLKEKLCNITQVPPEKQFLMGVYRPGQDADLQKKDLKNGQTLLMLGDPKPIPFSVGRAPEGSREEWLPDGYVEDSGTRSKIRAHTTKEEHEKILNGSYASELECLGQDPKPSIEAPDDSYQREGKAVTDEIVRLAIEAGKRKPKEIVPGTLPIEMLKKRVSQYTKEDRDKLQQYLNSTRTWSFNSTAAKMQKEEEEYEAEIAKDAVEEEEEGEETVAALEHEPFMVQYERDLNIYGASFVKGYNAVYRGAELMQTTDILVNETKFQEHEYELQGGGMNPDTNPQFQQDIEELTETVIEGDRRARQEAIDRDRQYRIFSKKLDKEIDLESLDRKPDANWRDEFYSDSDWDKSGFETKEPYRHYWDRELWHDPDVVRDLQDAGLHKYHKNYVADIENRRRVIHALRRLRTNREKRMQFLVLFDWPRENQEFPYGLKNIGNTCYMASVLQMMRCVPELMWDVAWFQPRDPLSFDDRQENVVHAAKKLFRTLGHKPMEHHKVRPYTFTHHLRQLYPQFAEMGMGGPMQQDAEEFLTAILQTFGAVLRDGAGESKVHKLFELEVESTIRCTDNKNEEETIDVERMLRLPLHIDGKTKWIHDAIKNTLCTTVEKTSQTLGREANYTVTGKISKLPPYLLMHFVRFYWRPDTQKKAKICRNVQFPFVVDMMPYLSDDLRYPIEQNTADRKAEYMKRNQVWDNPDDDDELSKKWAAYEKRESYHEQRAAKRLKIEQALLAANMSLEDYEFSSDSRDDDGNEKPNRQKEHVPQNTTDPEVPADLGRTFKGASICDTSSVYELRAIVTHEGRSADGGHYICWVKSGIRVPKQGKNDNAPEKYYWLHFNDDKVTLEYEEDVKNCAGSADGPIVYIALYGKCDQVGEGLIDDTIKPRKLDKRDRDEFKRCMQPYAENQAEILWEEYQRAQEDRRKWD